MAVKSVPSHQYFDQYKRRTLTIFIFVQIFGAAIACGIAYAIWQSASQENGEFFAFTVGLVVLIIANGVSSLFLFAIASRPHKLLSQAIAHVSKDPVVTPPPALATKDERTGLKALVQTVYDLTLNKQPQQEQLTSNTAEIAFKQLANNMPCGLIAVNADGAILYSNQLAPVKDTPNGQEISLLFEKSNDFKKWLADCVANKVRDTHTWQRIANNLPGEAEMRIFDVIAYYQKGEPGQTAAIIVTIDRTSSYAPDQEDMDFIALAAHELRGPITVIRGYLDVVKQELANALNPDQQELLDRLQVSSERLAGYVTNILNVSRYERNQFTIHQQEENLTNIINPLVPDLALRASTQNKKITFNIPADLPTIAADRSSIGEVITNLIDNAIKYSHDNGEVVVAAVPKDDTVEVTVKDSGIGIPESIVGELFNKFYRSHRSRQSVGGTGLGLYICKAIVESHGGSIWVRSTEGQGSTFGFTVPTYASVASKLQSGDNQNNDIVQRPEGWIKNHAMYRR